MKFLLLLLTQENEHLKGYKSVSYSITGTLERKESKNVRNGVQNGVQMNNLK